MNNKYLKHNNERGAVVVEATLILPMFVFLVITLMWIANLCTAQAKIQTAINSAAKEISSYSYLYGLTGLNSKRADLAQAGESGSVTAGDAMGGVKQIYSSLSALSDGGKQSFSGGDMFSDAAKTYDEVSGGATAIKESYEKIKSDPKGFLISLGSETGSIAIDKVAGYVIGGFGQYLTEKHLKADNYSANDYLKKLGVVGGFEGVNFGGSRFCNKGSDEIVLVAQYQLQPIRFFNIDVKYNIVQTARTKAWFGISVHDSNE